MFSIVAGPIYLPTKSVAGFPFFPHPHRHLLFVLFLMVAIDSCEEYLILVIICISLNNKVELLFMYVLTISVSSLEMQF